jgi:hypothetical protein
MFVLLLAPTRRLQAAGWPPRALGAYLLGMILIGLSFAVLPISARLAVPILVVGYLAPFVTARNGLDRLRNRGRAGMSVDRPPVKAVSGPARDVPATRMPDQGAPAATRPNVTPDEPTGPDEIGAAPARDEPDATDAPGPQDRA